MALAAIVTAVLFFLKRHIAIPAVIVLLIAYGAVRFMQTQAAGSIPSRLWHAYAFSAFWILYFLLSKQVKRTFIK